MTGSGGPVIFMVFEFDMIRLRLCRELDLVRGIVRLKWSWLTIVLNAGRLFASMVLGTRSLQTAQGSPPANARKEEGNGPAYSRWW